jgi:hypothetical protein|tara:strand:- start:296 stop:520 length:225 start_codon:yes stop_codon:yes gene_type:complete
MDLDDQIELEHLLFFDRKCTSCGKVKSLMDDFYLTRKNRGTLPSAYSYECKECTIERVKRKRKKKPSEWEYPDW